MKPQALEQLLDILKRRFDTHPKRHPDMAWTDVNRRLLAADDSSLRALVGMQDSGGEPDVIAHDKKSGAYTFCDCAAESPAGRRSLCYDREALDARKENKPDGSAVDRAAELGIDILSEEQYRTLQQLGEFDVKTSSWIATPAGIRQLGGALFCDRRYGKVFVYHNGAQSYYAARGFRGSVDI